MASDLDKVDWKAARMVSHDYCSCAQCNLSRACGALAALVGEMAEVIEDLKMDGIDEGPPQHWTKPELRRYSAMKRGNALLARAKEVIGGQ